MRDGRHGDTYDDERSVRENPASKYAFRRVPRQTAAVHPDPTSIVERRSSLVETSNLGIPLPTRTGCDFQEAWCNPGSSVDACLVEVDAEWWRRYCPVTCRPFLR